MLVAEYRASQLPPANKSIKFVPAVGLHRTPCTGRRLSSRYVVNPEHTKEIGLHG